VEAAGENLRVGVQIVDARTGLGLADSALTVPRGSGPAAAAALSVFVRHAFWSELDAEQRRARVHDPAAWALVERARENAEAAEWAVTERLDRQGFRSLDVADSLLREAGRLDGSSDLIPIELAHDADRRAFYAEYLMQALQEPPRDLPSPAAARATALAILDRLIRERLGPADAFELRGLVKEGLWRALGADSLLDGAIADYRSATELDLHRTTAWLYLGSALLSASQLTDALLAIQRAFDEDVFQLHRPDLLRNRFDAALGLQRYDLAAEACRDGTAELPDDVRFSDCELQLWSRTRSDRRTAALAVARAESLNGREGPALASAMRRLWTAEILARAGFGDSADHVDRRVLASAPKAWLPLLLSEAAYLRLLRRDPDSAVALVAAAARQGPTERRYLRNAAEFQPLRADPRFAAAVGEAPTRP
jgi:tetratricopeptide (TPR) repeat protein